MSFDWPAISDSELRRIDMDAAEDSLRRFFESPGGRLLGLVVRDAAAREQRRLRDMRASDQRLADGAIEANGRLDVLDLLTRDGLGLAGQIERERERRAQT